MDVEATEPREDATETFTFTPIGAMRSLENVELSAERVSRKSMDASSEDKRASGKRGRGTAKKTPTPRKTPTRRGSMSAAKKENIEVDAMAANETSEFAFPVQEETDAVEERRESKTFWASSAGEDSSKRTFVPLTHTNGLPPTPALYSAVPWPSSIPMTEKSPVLAATGVNEYSTPTTRHVGFSERAAQLRAQAAAMPAEPLAKTPKELAAQLAEVKQEIAKRQSDAIEISRMLRQLQREEADLYTRAAQIQRQLLNCTNESQPYDLTVLPDVASVEKIVSLQERKQRSPQAVKQQEDRDVGEDAQPSTSESVVNVMVPHQKLDVRKALISLDFIDGPGGLSLFTASADNCLRLWAPDSRKPVALMRAPRGLSASTIVNERVVCVGTDIGQVIQMDLATGQQLATLTQGEHAAPWSVKTLTRGYDNDTLIAAAGAGGDIKIWDARVARSGGSPVVMYSHGASEIRGISFGSDGRTIVAAASNDLRYFDLRMNGRSTRLSVPGDRQPDWMSVSHDYSTGELITTSSEGDVYAWSSSAPFPLSRALRKACAPRSSTIDVASGALLCPSGADGTSVDFLHHSTGDVVARWTPDASERSQITCVAMSSVGTRAQPYGLNSVAAGTASGSVVVFA